jgi:hypothetical protein
MADDSHEVSLVEEPVVEDTPVSEEETLLEPEEVEPTILPSVSPLNLSVVGSSDDKEHANGESKIVVHEEEPEVSFEGREEPSKEAQAHWTNGLTPRAAQVEASHAEELERLKSELEAAKAEVARLQLETREKDATISKQQAELEKAAKPAATPTKITPKATGTGTPSKPVAKTVAAKPSPAPKGTSAKIPAATTATAKPTAVKPTPTTAKATVAKPKATPAAPPKPAGTAKKVSYGDAPPSSGQTGKLAVSSPVRKLHTVSKQTPASRDLSTSPAAKATAKPSSAKPATAKPTYAPPVSSTAKPAAE